VKIGLALSGGGARSFCQVGVIKVLEREGIKIDVVTGTSMGSMVGSMYCVAGDAYSLEQAIIEFTERKEVKRIETFFTRQNNSFFTDTLANFIKNFYLLISETFRVGLIPSNRIVKDINNYFKKDFYFSDFDNELGIVAVEYNSGKITVFNEGKIVPAVVASCALPGLITPLDIKGKIYLDGGVASNLPVLANAFLGADVVIGIENSPDISCRKPKNTYDVFIQSEKIKSKYGDAVEKNFSDCTLSIVMNNVEWFHFSSVRECIKKGEEIALKNIKSIKKALQNSAWAGEGKTRKNVLESMKEFFLTESSV
jgi:NTE family protein